MRCQMPARVTVRIVGGVSQAAAHQAQAGRAATRMAFSMHDRSGRRPSLIGRIDKACIPPPCPSRMFSASPIAGLSRVYKVYATDQSTAAGLMSTP